MPIDPSFAVNGAEWRIDGFNAAETGAQPAAGSGGFGAMLGNSLDSLAATQTEAAQAAQALATGQATDPTAVVMAVERAQLAMQLASQIRTKAVEAAQDIFHTQV
jgi:flagellar hook-basal body complex protein FliE